MWKKEDATSPSVLPGARRRQHPLPDLPPNSPGMSPADASPRGHHETEMMAPQNPLEAGAAVPPAVPPANPPSESGDEPDEGGAPFFPEDDAALSGPPAPPDDAPPFSASNGEGEPPAPPPGGPPLPPESPAWLRVLREFYAALQWTEADAAELLAKRGLTAETCARAGFRSNDPGNKDIILELATRWPVEVMVQSGLFEESSAGPVPNRHFFGYGLVTRKGRDGQPLYKWKSSGKCNPVLIPYFNEHGALVRLRPHKGGAKGQPALLYVCRQELIGLPAAEKRAAQVLITEGEFKAWAAWQGLNSGDRPSYEVCAMPGISFSSNHDFMCDLRDFLGAPRRVAVVYDNELKTNPDKTKRHDAEIRARHLAILLGLAGHDARVGRLPDEWRDEKGKADWDGALVRLPAGEVRTRFRQVLAEAKAAKNQVGLFEDEVERIIANGVERLFYKPKLLAGGAKEGAMVRKIQAVLDARARRRDGGGQPDGVEIPMELKLGQVFRLIKFRDAYKAIDRIYYDVKEPSDKGRTALYGELKWAQDAGDKELEKIYKQIIEGTPVPVSNFTMSCHYRLVLESGDRNYIVTALNIWGEKTGMVELDSRSFTSPRDFRTWLSNHGGLVWMAGEKELERLQWDLKHESAYREVFQVVAFGHHDLSGLEFFDDCAITPDGQMLYPDNLGDGGKVFWYGGAGYQVSKQGMDGQGFLHGRPVMHPQQRLDFDKGGYVLRSAEEGEGWDLETEHLRSLFRDVASAFNSAQNIDGMWFLGSVLAFPCAPEIVAELGGFPGVFLVGEKGQGKTFMAQWGVELFGFHQMDAGIGLQKSSTAAGLQIVAEQYSGLPVWLDEYDDSLVAEDKIGIIHAAFNRELPAKWSPLGRMRKMRTGFVVSGETSAGKTSTRSRYPILHVHRTRRVGTSAEQVQNFEWLQAHRKFFFTLGRHVLRHRAEFAARLLGHFKTWRDGAATAGIDARAKIVHGVSVAAFAALAEMLGTHPPATVAALGAHVARMWRACGAGCAGQRGGGAGQRQCQSILDGRGGGVCERGVWRDAARLAENFPHPQGAAGEPSAGGGRHLPGAVLFHGRRRAGVDPGEVIFPGGRGARLPAALQAVAGQDDGPGPERSDGADAEPDVFRASALLRSAQAKVWREIGAVLSGDRPGQA